MARANVDAWIQEEHDGSVITRVRQVSAVEALGRPVPMGTATKTVPRSGRVGVAVTAKGAAYNEEQPTNDEVLLTARKFTALIRIAEEDISDLPASGVTNYVRDKQLDWAGSYGRFFDNACLGVSAASNGATVPFTSVYRAVTTADATVSYLANANHVSSAGVVTYDGLSNVLGLIEGGSFYDPSTYQVIAHPAFLSALRGVKDGQARPIFDDTQVANGTATIFGMPIRFSLGAIVSTVASDVQAVASGLKGTAGNPLLVVAPRDHLIVGMRSGPEYANISGWDGASAVTDEALIKMRSRRGFSVGDVNAISVLERTSA